MYEEPGPDPVRIIAGIVCIVILIAGVTAHLENAEVTVYNCVSLTSGKNWDYLYAHEKRNLTAGMREVMCTEKKLPAKTVWTLRSR